MASTTFRVRLTAGAFALHVAALGGAVACSSGPGGPSGTGPVDPYEPPGSTYENPGSTYESPYADGGGGSLALAPCTGMYNCSADGAAFTLTLAASNGECTASSNGTTVTLESNGDVTDNGETVGTWQGAATALAISSADAGSIVCTE